MLRNLYDALQFGYAPLPLAPAIAFATVADRSRPLLRWLTRRRHPGGVAYSQALPGHNQPYDAIVQASIFGAAWAIGTLSRYRRAALRRGRRSARRGPRRRSTSPPATRRRRRAVRIARELHDVVAHHVSLMAVQAEAVGALLPGPPAADAAASADLIAVDRPAGDDRAAPAARGAARSSADQDRSPNGPGLLRLPPCLAWTSCWTTVRDAGLPVTCQVAGSPAALPPGIDLTAYRIVQEALTNALRHAPGSRRVRALPTRTRVSSRSQVTNTGDPPAPAAPPDRRASPQPAPATLPPRPSRRAGVRPGGIAERVASCGGSLALGPAAAAASPSPPDCR